MKVKIKGFVGIYTVVCFVGGCVKVVGLTGVFRNYTIVNGSPKKR